MEASVEGSYKELLKFKITEALSKQGFQVNGHVVPIGQDKESFKLLHSASKIEQLGLHKSFLKQSMPYIKKYLINGRDIEPDKIQLSLREVRPDSKEEILFKWWNFYWWSVPYQRAYGRQMRLLLWDNYHNAPFGLIGMQSPVLKMAVRDNYLNIPKEKLDLWINKSMQAQRLGALPPYNELIGGKMVAMALTSNELRQLYYIKYEDRSTILKDRIIEPDLLFISTTSAFGRSSIYNRLKYYNSDVAISLGYTKGSGTFHIPQDLYKEILNYLSKNGIETSTTFGNGPSKKLKLIYKALMLLELPNYTFHNIKREFFLFPLVENLKDVISKNEKPIYVDRTLISLQNFWKNRWALPRSQRNQNWKEFSASDFENKFWNEINKPKVYGEPATSFCPFT